MTAWFTGLERREQWVVLIGAALLLVVLLYVGVWERLSNSVQSLRAQTEQQAASLAWMRAAAQEAQQLHRRAAAAPAPGGASVLSLVDGSARAQGLSLKRVQPEGEGRARVWLEAASFDALIPWLTGLETAHRVRVVNAVFEGLAAPGRVNAQLVLEAGR
jgi:general secretion pathway protein M